MLLSLAAAGGLPGLRHVTEHRRTSCARLFSPALLRFLELLCAASCEVRARQCHRRRRGAKPLIPAQLCSKVRVDKLRLLSSKRRGEAPVML